MRAWPRVLLLFGAWAYLSTAAAAQWEQGPGYRRALLETTLNGKPGFSLVPSEISGITFSNLLPEALGLTNHVFQDGSGVAAGDVDGDGKCDLYFCAINGSNRLYRNLGGWHFQDITAQAGVSCDGLHSSGAAFADLDGDGDLDLIVNTVGNGTLIFFNDGRGHFVRAPFVLNPGRAGQSLALADIDGDGYLDLYVVNYRLRALMDLLTPGRFTFKQVDGKKVVATFNGRPTTDADLIDRFAVDPRGNFQENGEADVLYRNITGTNFTALSFTNGDFLDEDGQPLRRAPPDWGLSAMFRDINRDGLPDLYVCNDFQSPDRFWINQGGGKFRLLSRLAQRKSSISSMSVDFADINRDGFDDFFVVDMLSRHHAQRMRVISATYAPDSRIGYFEDRPQYELNTLFLNRGDNTFAETAQASGLEAAEWAWSCVFLDVDLDGWEDLLIANGMERDGRDLDIFEELKKLRRRPETSETEILKVRRKFPRQANGNLAFRNRGDLAFEESSHAWGFDWKGVSSAMALADLDGDGALDVIVNTLNGPALLYRNTSSAPRIAIRLKGQAPNSRGIGARISVSAPGLPQQSQEMICGGRYLSCDDTIRTFAAGSETNAMTVSVDWRSGKRSVITHASPNFLYEIDETRAEQFRQPGNVPPPSRNANDAFAGTLFSDASALLRHTHHEEPFDDFARQPLLPNKLSQLGPGVAWFDIDGDGREDLVIGTGKSGQIGIYLNRGTNGFVALDEPAFAGKAMRDQTAILGWLPSAEQRVLFAGCANYEDSSTNGPAVQQYGLGDKRISDAVAANGSSTGPLALAELAGDGNLELFVGGRVIPARYPEGPSSRLFKFEKGRWTLDAENTKALEKAGLVSGAIFTDLDGDGFPDLVLACEWGPLRIFHNNHGMLTETNFPLTVSVSLNSSKPSTLNQLTGWWNSVAAGDFDGDGKMDLIAGNWGRNTKYQSHRDRPLKLYYGDFAGDGTVQVVEASYDPELQKTVPEQPFSRLAEGLPFLRGRFSSYAAYSTASVDEALGDRLKAAGILEANWLETTIFLNRGDHFEARTLPIEAQLAPVFGLCVADFDGDGREDIFLAQNFFATHPDTPRYDAGRGLLLIGDGLGDFHAMPGRESGIEIYGEQRGAAVCDFDGDGRLDLVVAQNGAETRLYHNTRAKPGLRVRLKGAGNNLQGFGATLRLKGGGKWGPAREIHGGGGYWSQDSAVQVLAAPETAAAAEIQVRWPGGRVTTSAVPAGAREMTIRSDGTIAASE